MKVFLKTLIVVIMIELLLFTTLAAFNVVEAKWAFLMLCLFLLTSIAYILVGIANDKFDDIDAQLDEYMTSDSPEPEYEEIEQDYDYWPDRY